MVFAGAGGAAALRPRALVDLDTLAPMPLGFELGDAWRSWCNPRGEDSIEAIFDLQVFAASLDGYLAGVGRALDEKERAALLGGVEWVSVELAARFCADALQERYFGWDARRFRGSRRAQPRTRRRPMVAAPGGDGVPPRAGAVAGAFAVSLPVSLRASLHAAGPRS